MCPYVNQIAKKDSRAQGSRLLLDLLGKGGGQGRAEEVLHGPKISVAEAVFANVIQIPVFP